MLSNLKNLYMQSSSLEPELIPKSLFFLLHLAMSVPCIARNSCWGMLGLAFMTLAAVGK